MSDKEMDHIMFAIIAAFAVGGLVGVLVCGSLTNSTWKGEAVKHHAADFIISDSASGATEFKWRLAP